MGLTTAERNKQKRERKKLAKEEERKRLELEEAAAKNSPETETDDVEIEYVAEPLFTSGNDTAASETNQSTKETNENDASAEDNNISAVLRRFHARATALVSDDDEKDATGDEENDIRGEKKDNEDEDDTMLSNRKLRDMIRPTVAELKNRVDRSDLVEAHDVTSNDPDFLLFLKAVPATVPVPRHWGRKRKYLQGKVSFLNACLTMFVTGDCLHF